MIIGQTYNIDDCSTFLDIYLNAVSNVENLYPHKKRSDGFHYVIDFDLEELRRLTIFERIRPSNKSPVFPLRFPTNANVSFQLATLNETIELLFGLNRATGQYRQLLIEIKKPEYHAQNGNFISDIVLATLEAYNLTEPTDPVVIQTFHIEELIRIRQNLRSRLRLFALMTWNRVNESSSDYDFYRSESGIRYLSNYVQGLTPDHQFVVNYQPNGTILNTTNLTQWAHQYGLKVYPFTFRKDFFPGTNFEELLEYFWLNVQVDGFITDHPDVVLEFLKRRMALVIRENVYMNHSASVAIEEIIYQIILFIMIQQFL